LFIEKQLINPGSSGPWLGITFGCRRILLQTLIEALDAGALVQIYFSKQQEKIRRATFIKEDILAAIAAENVVINGFGIMK
jgi:hypothetical protein